MLRNRFHQLHGLYTEGVRQRDNVEQSDVAFATLNATDVVPMKVRQLRQTLLREPTLRPQFADAPAKDNARVRSLHLDSYGPV